MLTNENDELKHGNANLAYDFKIHKENYEDVLQQLKFYHYFQ